MVVTDTQQAYKQCQRSGRHAAVVAPTAYCEMHREGVARLTVCRPGYLSACLPSLSPQGRLLQRARLHAAHLEVGRFRHTRLHQRGQSRRRPSVVRQNSRRRDRCLCQRWQRMVHS
jgi:hypothetical protein